ncbi:hypothetical protein M422DRAFT_243486 [Sphaerobolus stellatus SS14]|nr:hypothetical protein M422DRAFT_243486 [Sphaerobolus stellatus SS14]
MIGSHPFLDIFLTTPFPILKKHIFLLAEDPGAITVTPVLEKVRTSALFGGLAPNLRSVVWDCTYIPPFSGNPWRNLRSLQFSLTLGIQYPAEPSWRQLMLILSINSNLEDLTVVIPPFEEHLGPNCLTLSSLRRATFVVPKTQRFDPFFQSISIPNMKDIAIFSFDSSTSTTRMFSALGAQTKRQRENRDIISQSSQMCHAVLWYFRTAGSDTTANSTAAIRYWIYKTPSVLQKLRSELDEALRNSKDPGLPPSEIVVESEETEQEEGLGIPLHEQVKNLKYLNATIDEDLRMFATNAFGLPCVVPDGMDVSIDGKSFLPGTELSVSAYTMQRDPRI